MSEIKYLTVTALTKYMKTKIDNDPHLRIVYLKAEISNFKHHSRGHMYLTLKDDGSRIKAVMFASQNKSLPFIPEDGMKVLVCGEVSVFESSGEYQIYIKTMEPDGIGSLYLAYEQLKSKLEEEGLFSPLFKKEIPKYPHVVGVITSPTGAAVRDIITTIERRYPIAKIIVFPTLVQGVNASSSIVKSIKKANERTDIDVLIVGRGGGSIEDLWAFNEESTIRAISASHIPIISAVGHETDTTISDFVSDLRAPTPTAAAELAVPNIKELIEIVNQHQHKMNRAFNENIQTKKNNLLRLQQSYAFKYPERLVKEKEQQLDKLFDKLYQQTNSIYQIHSNRLNSAILKLQANHPTYQLSNAKKNHDFIVKNLRNVMDTYVKQKQFEFEKSVSKLELLSPLSIMNRGYSLVYNEEQKIVKHTTDIKVDDKIMLSMQDGQVECQVLEIKKP